MKAHSNKFKEAISLTNEIDNKLTYEDNKRLENLKGLSLVTYSSLLKTVMKQLEFKSNDKLTIDTIVNYQMGVKVENNYEYLDYGDFIVQATNWNADENLYEHVCYDKMLYTMIEYDNTGITYPITVRNYINTIATKCGLVFANNNDEFVNYNVLINEDHFDNGVYTFRDILDYLAEIVAGWFIINENGELAIKYPTETGEVFDKDFLRDTNITFKSKYGAVNSIVFSRGAGTDNIYRKDDNDINVNGLHELRLYDNPFLEGTDRENFIDGVYNKLHGLQFYIMDVSSTGIGYLEVGDLYTFKLTEAQAIKSGLYKSGLFKAQSDGSGSVKCMLINDEMDLSGGLIETIYADEPDESVTNYRTSAPTDNSIKNAIITTNKNAGEIVLKANSDGKIVQVELKGNADNGSVFNVDADNINLTANDIINLIAGNSINLTSKNITINSDNFNVDNDGNATINNATITGGSIELSADNTNPKLKINNNQFQDSYTQFFSNAIRMTKDGRATLTIGNNLTNPLIVGFGNTSDDGFSLSPYSFYITTLFERTTITASGITTPTLTQTSKEEYKKNFERLVNAREILKNTDIYKYNLKSDNDTDKKHIGFVIGDKFNYSEEITSKDNDGVDIYSMISVLWQVVKEQEEEIKLLKERIDK